MSKSHPQLLYPGSQSAPATLPRRANVAIVENKSFMVAKGREDVCWFELVIIRFKENKTKYPGHSNKVFSIISI